MPDPFEKRIRRAEALEKEWPFAADLLRFYRGLIACQRRIFEHPPEAFPDGEEFTQGFMSDLAALIDCLAADGPKMLADEARHWKPDVAKKWWTEHGRPHQPLNFCTECPSPLYHFLMSVFNQTHSLHRRLNSKKDATYREPANTCPFCEQPPGVSVLREDKSAETTRRSLVCSHCSLEWDFARVLCPNCNEEKPEKLPRYTAQEIPWMRVEGCDSCGKYLKSVDLTLNWEAEPVVDELASTPLDVIAREHGYTKITPNLAGI